MSHTVDTFSTFPHAHRVLLLALFHLSWQRPFVGNPDVCTAVGIMSTWVNVLCTFLHFGKCCCFISQDMFSVTTRVRQPPELYAMALGKPGTFFQVWSYAPATHTVCLTMYALQSEEIQSDVLATDCSLNCILLFLLLFHSIWSNSQMPVRHKPSSSLPSRPCLIYYYNHKDFRPTTSTIR